MPHYRYDSTTGTLYDDVGQVVSAAQPKQPKQAPLIVPEPADIIPSTPHLPALAYAPRQVVNLQSSHSDRARGFLMATAPLAGVLALGVLALAVALWHVPLLSGAAVLIILAGMAVTWLIAWLWYTAASPDGATLVSVLLQYRLLRHEQKARLERLAQMNHFGENYK